MNHMGDESVCTHWAQLKDQNRNHHQRRARVGLGHGHGTFYILGIEIGRRKITTDAFILLVGVTVIVFKTGFGVSVRKHIIVFFVAIGQIVVIGIVLVFIQYKAERGTR